MASNLSQSLTQRWINYCGEFSTPKYTSSKISSPRMTSWTAVGHTASPSMFILDIVDPLCSQISILCLTWKQSKITMPGRHRSNDVILESLCKLPHPMQTQCRCGLSLSVSLCVSAQMQDLILLVQRFFLLQTASKHPSVLCLC